MTDHSAAGLHHVVKTAYSNMGLDMAAMTSGISKAYFQALAPSVSSLVGPMFADSTMNIGSLIAQSIDTSGIRNLISGMASSVSVSKQLADSYASLGKQLAPSLSDIYPTLKMDHFLASNTELQKTVASLTSSMAHTIDASFAQSLLAQATVLRDELDSQDDDDDPWAFYEPYPEPPAEIVEAIDGLSFPIALSTAERQLIVWFIGTIVALYVTMGVVNISLDSPEFGALLSGLGIAGPTTGIAAGKVTGKLLDKLPQAEES